MSWAVSLSHLKPGMIRSLYSDHVQPRCADCTRKSEEGGVVALFCEVGVLSGRVLLESAPEQVERSAQLGKLPEAAASPGCTSPSRIRSGKGAQPMRPFDAWSFNQRFSNCRGLHA